MQRNRMGETRDLFNKTGDTNGKFHARIGTIKDRKGRDLVDAEEIKKRWKEYIKELYKRDLNEFHYYSGVILT